MATTYNIVLKYLLGSANAHIFHLLQGNKAIYISPKGSVIMISKLGIKNP